MMRKIRVHIRDNGLIKFKWGVQRCRFTWGYNVYFGRLFVAVREKNGQPSKFIELQSGKAQRYWLKNLLIERQALQYMKQHSMPFFDQLIKFVRGIKFDGKSIPLGLDYPTFEDTIHGTNKGIYNVRS